MMNRDMEGRTGDVVMNAEEDTVNLEWGGGASADVVNNFILIWRILSNNFLIKGAVKSLIIRN